MLKKIKLNVLLITIFLMFVSLFSISAAAVPKSIESIYGENRSQESDVVYFRNGDVLRGAVLGYDLTMVTSYGTISVPYKMCVGISFEGAQANSESIITDNLNRFTGLIMGNKINFKIKSSNTIITIRKEKIKFILFKQEENERSNSKASDNTNLFQMTNGDLLTGQPEPLSFLISTDYANVPVNIEEIYNIVMQGDNNPIAVISKKNKDVMRGQLATEEISVKLDIGITIDLIYKDKFAKIFIDDGNIQISKLFGGSIPILGESNGANFNSLMSGAQEEVIIPNSNGVKIDFKKVPAGKFLMGSSSSESGRDDDEGPRHEVNITKDYMIGTYEVTQEEWEAVMGNNPSNWKGLGLPVEKISWYDAIEFCNELSRIVGRDPVYNINGTSTTCDFTKNGFRIPTEAEWEYAARGGGLDNYKVYSGSNDINEVGWYGSNSGSKTHTIGQKEPNKLGIYDMSGNVWEWCWDWYDSSYYTVSSDADPIGPSSGSFRVVRGGGWYYYSGGCRSASRSGSGPGYGSNDIGFRLSYSL